MEQSPQRENELIAQILRDQVGINPRSLRPVLRLTALGVVNSAWRRMPQPIPWMDEALAAFICQAEGRGVGFAFRRAAAHGGLACRHWWGHPGWPEVVDRFIRALDDPADPHWGDNGEFRGRLRPEPVGHLRQHHGWRSTDAGLRTLVRSVRRSR